MKVVQQTPTYLQLKHTEMEWALFSCIAGLLCFFFSLSGLRSGLLHGQVLGAFALLAGVGAVLLGLLWIELWIVWTFDKTQGTLTLRRQYGLRSQQIKRPLPTLDAVEVAEEEDGDRRTHYIIHLLLKSGETLKLRGITVQPNAAEVHQTADLIRKFLHG